MAINPVSISQSTSETSTTHRCDNCSNVMDQVNCRRCHIDEPFHLCEVCEKIDYNEPAQPTLDKHRQLHLQNVLIAENSSEEANREAVLANEHPLRLEKISEHERILQQGRINNEEEMFTILKSIVDFHPSLEKTLKCAIAEHFREANAGKVNVINLDGEGVRGYMPMKILTELITQKYLPDIPHFDVNNVDHRDRFHRVQSQFARPFDYFIGTSTGALIVFCLAIGYNILDIMEIFADAKHYFKRNRLGSWVGSKCNPSRIHKKIDEIIEQIHFPGKGKISAKHATLLDIHNLLNPDDIVGQEKIPLGGEKYGFPPEIVISKCVLQKGMTHDAMNSIHQVRREKVLLVPAYNSTRNNVILFNTSRTVHWGYRIADVLKCSIATPTCFSAQKVYHGVRQNGIFVRDSTPDSFIDGGVFIKDPDLAALWSIHVQWEEFIKYHVWSIGSGTYSSSLSPKKWHDFFGWIFNNRVSDDKLKSVIRRLLETIEHNLMEFEQWRRVKVRYMIKNQMDLDDPEFVALFDDEWRNLKNEAQYGALRSFYEKHIVDEK